MYWNFQMALTPILCGFALYATQLHISGGRSSLISRHITNWVWHFGGAVVYLLFICLKKIRGWLLGCVACWVFGVAWKVFCWCWRWCSSRTYRTNLKLVECLAWWLLPAETLWVIGFDCCSAGWGVASIACEPLSVPVSRWVLRCWMFCRSVRCPAASLLSVRHLWSSCNCSYKYLAKTKQSPQETEWMFGACVALWHWWQKIRLSKPAVWK